MPARFAILVLVVGVFLQPLLAGIHGTDDCCAIPDTPAPVFAPEGDDHECSCCEATEAAGENHPSDRDRSDHRPRGCDCPKSCCTNIVKAPLGVTPASTGAEWRDSAENLFDDAPGIAGDAWTSRLKRPPRAFAAV
ncbi:MAG TPA: hypothetical protein PLU35_03205 [Phycisphaerales bacterium]|nr:hypothetical protein [Phycisphaerales bacterium]